MKLAMRGVVPGLGRSAVAGAPGNLQKGCSLGDDELDKALSGEAEPSRAGQRCAPGPRHAKGEAASASPGSLLAMQSPGPHPRPSELEPAFEQVPGWFTCTSMFEKRCSGPAVPRGSFLISLYLEMLLGKRDSVLSPCGQCCKVHPCEKLIGLCLLGRL